MTQKASTFTVTASKTSADTKVGLVFHRVSNDKSKLFVKKISEGGLFESSDLDVYDEIITINGTDMTDKSSAEATEIVKSIQTGKVTIEAKRPHGAAGAITFIDLPSPAIIASSVEESSARIIKQSRDRMPNAMKGVPLAKWARIHDAIRMELLPPTKKTLLLHDYDVEFDRRTDRSGVPGGKNQSHTDDLVLLRNKKKNQVTKLLQQEAASADMVASDVQVLANCLLAPHGLMARKVILNHTFGTSGRSDDRKVVCGENCDQIFHADNYVCFGLKFISIDAKPEASIGGKPEEITKDEGTNDKKTAFANDKQCSSSFLGGWFD